MPKMRRFLYLTVVLLPMLLLAEGCYYDVEEELYPNGVCNTTNVTFSGTVLPLMQSHCAVPTCHVSVGGNGAGDFTAYAGVMEKVNSGAFADRVLVQRNMPPSTHTQLRACDLQQLQAWLDAGSPNN